MKWGNELLETEFKSCISNNHIFNTVLSIIRCLVYLTEYLSVIPIIRTLILIFRFFVSVFLDCSFSLSLSVQLPLMYSIHIFTCHLLEKTYCWHCWKDIFLISVTLRSLCLQFACKLLQLSCFSAHTLLVQSGSGSMYSS